MENGSIQRDNGDWHFRLATIITQFYVLNQPTDFIFHIQKMYI